MPGLFDPLAIRDLTRLRTTSLRVKLRRVVRLPSWSRLRRDKPARPAANDNQYADVSVFERRRLRERLAFRSSRIHESPYFTE
jgi:hypothetical protein